MLRALHAMEQTLRSVRERHDGIFYSGRERLGDKDVSVGNNPRMIWPIARRCRPGWWKRP
jgi:hypothetical protein